MNERSVLHSRRVVINALTVMAFATSAYSQASVDADHAEQMKAGLAVFKSDVKSIIADNCLKCHNANSKKGDFDLSSRESLVESGHLGESAADSYLLQLLRHEEDPHMPWKKDRLSDKQIELLAKWIDLKAPYDKPFEAIHSKGAMTVTDEDRAFWSFAPLREIAMPRVADESWCRTDMDRFILKQIEDAGLSPNRPTDRRTLVRRAYFDLIGLPPHPAEVDHFIADKDPLAYEKLIDRLLQSRHYGERWARHWLDVARFAESSGFEHDDDRPNAFHYRDFVIKAFNDDLPFDDFIRFQLAGDELAPNNSLAAAATGFLSAGPFPTQLTEVEFESARYDELDDMVTNTGLAFLGLSVGCARCHDHKFDPIPTRDYYRMAATFAKSVRAEVDLIFEPASTPVKVQITGDGYPPMKNHADGRGYPYFYKDVHFLRRGDVTQKEGVADPGFVQVLCRSEQEQNIWRHEPPQDWQRSEFRRASLADWITDPNFGAGHLAARVIVNRLWQHHFGRGLVGTPNDFGMQGERPTHPELLDWLANELIANDWSLKHIHKLMMTSSVYMQSDLHDEARAAIDVSNMLHWRRTPRRLEAEAIRDAMLSVSGLLDTTMYGPGTLDESMRRRSIYFTIKRSKLIPTMMLFDWPEHLVSIGQRPVTTTAPQALLFMNNPQARSLAEALAQRISSRISGQDESRNYDAVIGQTYELAFGRAATEKEVQLSKQFVNQQQKLYSAAGNEDAERLALADFAQMILSNNEFIFIR